MINSIYSILKCNSISWRRIKEYLLQAKRLCIKNNKIITFDANYRDALFCEDKDTFVSCCKDFIKDSKIVKLSDEEACLISGMENIEEAAKYIIDLGCENLIITLGKRCTSYN